MSADLLRRAAKLLRECAEAASSGPWLLDDEPDYSGVWFNANDGLDAEIENARYIALMHPPVALALAAWLEAAANDAWDMGSGEAAIAVARAILREAP